LCNFDFLISLENVSISCHDDLPESNTTTTTADKEVFKYLSQTRSDLFGCEKKLLNSV